MAYFRYEVRGGEFVIDGERDWRISFNGIRIGGVYACANDAIAAIGVARLRKVPGPDLRGVPDPPRDLTEWQTRISTTP